MKKILILISFIGLTFGTIYAEDRNKMFEDTRKQIITELEKEPSYATLYKYTYSKYFDYYNAITGTTKKYKSSVKNYTELSREVEIKSIIHILKNGTADNDEKYITIYYKAKNEKEKKTIPNTIDFKYLEEEKKWVIEGIGFIYE